MVKEIASRTINILVLGASGSGKTVYLATLYNRHLQNKDSYYFTTNPEDEEMLRQEYEKVTSPSSQWPDGTSNEKDWTFTCGVDGHTACNFRYLDYAGGTLFDDTIDDDDDERLRLTYRINHMIDKEATILLGFLDGRKVSAYLEDKTSMLATRLVFTDLVKMYPFMSRNNSITIHFVITKWDLVRNYLKKRPPFKQFSPQNRSFLENLGTRSSNRQDFLLSFNESSLDSLMFDYVKDKLLEIEDFKKLVDSRRNKPEYVRLIPLSSVGDGFVDTGGFRKTGKPIDPFMVEAPLVLALRDTVELPLKRLQWRYLGRSLFKKLWGFIKSFLPGAVSDFAPFPFFKGIPKFLLEWLLDLLEADIPRRLPKRFEMRPFTELEKEWAALLKLSRHFREVNVEFRRTFPNNVISKSKEKKNVKVGFK
jgi:hypothetical protein